jgi:hypothetical protein
MEKVQKLSNSEKLYRFSVDLEEQDTYENCLFKFSAYCHGIGGKSRKETRSEQPARKKKSNYNRVRNA